MSTPKTAANAEPPGLELTDGVWAGPGRAVPLEFCMDAAFFQRDILRVLAARGCACAIKVGYWSWLPLKQLPPTGATR